MLKGNGFPICRKACPHCGKSQWPERTELGIIFSGPDQFHGFAYCFGNICRFSCKIRIESSSKSSSVKKNIHCNIFPGNTQCARQFIFHQIRSLCGSPDFQRIYRSIVPRNSSVPSENGIQSVFHKMLPVLPVHLHKDLSKSPSV